MFVVINKHIFPNFSLSLHTCLEMLEFFDFGEEDDEGEDDVVQFEEVEMDGGGVAQIEQIVDAPVSGKKQKTGRVSLKNKIAPVARKDGDNFAQASAGKPRDMPGTMKGRNGVFNKFQFYHKTQFKDITELGRFPESFFNDENLSLFLLFIGDTMGHGQSAFKTVNAALNDWLVKRRIPKYSEALNQHLYPQVIEALRVIYYVAVACMYDMKAINKNALPFVTV